MNNVILMSHYCLFLLNRNLDLGIKHFSMCHSKNVINFSDYTAPKHHMINIQKQCPWECDRTNKKITEKLM